MNAQQLLDSLAERVSAYASEKSVYGDPLVVGDQTVIPVAPVCYGFGGGAGVMKTQVAAEANVVHEPAMRYLNRLSDLFFVASRHANAGGAGHVLWVPAANR